MAYSYQDWTVSDTAATAFTFTKDFLLQSHVKVWYKSVTANSVFVEWDSSYYTISGASGSATATLTGSAPARAIGDTIRIKRTTPATKAGRLVDFQAGSLSESDLDTSALQTMFIAQEVVDRLDDSIGLDATGTSWDAESKKVTSVGAGSTGSDAARLQDVWNQVTGAGSLPAVTAANEGATIAVVGGAWTLIYAATLKAALGLGAAADLNVNTGSGTDLMSLTYSDTRYMRPLNALSEIVPYLAAAQANLGLATGAFVAHGTSANQLVKFDANARYPGNDGRNIDLSLNALNFGRTDAYAHFNLDAPPTITTSYTTQPLAAITASQHNGDNQITVSTAFDTFTLAAGSYRVLVVFTVKNAHATSNAGFRWQIRNTSAGNAVVYESPDFAHMTGGQSAMVTVVREVFLSYGVVSSFDIQAKNTLAGTLNVIDSQISITKVT